MMDSASNSDELPSTSSVKYECILHCGQPCAQADSLDNITEQKWQSIRDKSLRWKGLDRFQNACENVDWGKGP